MKTINVSWTETIRYRADFEVEDDFDTDDHDEISEVICEVEDTDYWTVDVTERYIQSVDTYERTESESG